MKKTVIILLIIALIFSAAMLLIKRKQHIRNVPLPSRVNYAVEVVSPEERPIRQTRSFLAQLVAKDIARLSSKLSGQIREIPVLENQPVKKGDILARIDDREIISSFQALNSTLKAQMKEMEHFQNLFDRNKVLFETGGLAKEKLDASEVEFFHKQAALEATRQKMIAVKAQLSYLTITAPFDGVVGTIYLQTGSLATPGQPMVTVNSSSRKLVFNFVPERTDIIPGNHVIFEDKIIGGISRLYSDAKNGLAVAEIFLEKDLARPNGSYLTIDVVTFEGVGCTVPVNALLHRQNTTQIMVYENNFFRPVHVAIIAQNKKYAMIDPCPVSSVAVGAEAKLGQLPAYGRSIVSHEKKKGSQHD